MLAARKRPVLVPLSRTWGVAIAFVTAWISGVAIFANGYAVNSFPDPSLYTTIKNLVAAILLLALGTAATVVRSGDGFTWPHRATEALGLVAVATIGGSVPFLLFFEGLSRAASVDAAFVHKTLVVWVALLAVPLLKEKLHRLHVGAIALLVIGQASSAGGVLDLSWGSGEVMILGATLMWSVEVVLAKRLLRSLSPATVGVARMAGGVVILIAYTAAAGDASQLFSLDAQQWGWALLTGLILAGYVATWYTALARAQAVDVTAVLVFGAVITALLEAVVQGVDLGVQLPGLVLVTLGAALIGVLALRGARPAAL